RARPGVWRGRRFLRRQGLIDHGPDQVAVDHADDVIEFLASGRVRTEQGRVAQQQPGRIERDRPVIELSDEDITPADCERAEARAEHRLADIVADYVKATRRDLKQLAVEALAALNHHDLIRAGRAQS